MSDRPAELCGRAIVVLLYLGTNGCSSKPDDVKAPDVKAPDVSAAACETPVPPDLGSLASRTVGDGTVSSCTEAALHTTLEQAGSIHFACGPDPVTIPITATLHVLDKTELDGGGLVTLDGGNVVRILDTADRSTVVIKGLHFEHGYAASSGGGVARGWASNLFVASCAFRNNAVEGKDVTAGALFAGSAGWLTVVDSVFEGNVAPDGGAIHEVLSNLTVVNSTFRGNKATGVGGALFTDGAYVPQGGANGKNGGKLEICGTRFIDNEAVQGSGAAYFYAYGDDQLIVNRSEFTGNRATSSEGALGGALRFDAITFISNTLFADNQTTGQGGALWIGRGPAVFQNVTFFGNHADLWGGAISYANEFVDLEYCTLSYNTAGQSVGGLYGGTGATPKVHGSLFYENGPAGDTRHCRRAIDARETLVFPASASDVCGSGATVLDPKLADSLADAGGFTQTQALGDASPALGAGSGCPSTDQRGNPRPAQGCDLGAFEYP